MKAKEKLKAIKSVIKHRLANGAKEENIKGYLEHLQNETYKNSPYMCLEISKIKSHYCLTL